MKKRKNIVYIASVIAAGMLTGCLESIDTLPDSGMQTQPNTDVISESTQTTAETVTTAAQMVTEQSVTAETVSAVTEAVQIDVSNTEPTETEETVETVQTSAETVSETTADVSSTTDVSEVRTETLPSETTAYTEQTRQQVTVVTLPVSVEQTQSTAAAEVSESMPASENYYPVQNYYTLNFDRQKAMWISYLEYDRIMKGASEEEFKTALGQCFDNIAALGCNTVYFQVRAYGDAYYSSKLFPRADRSSTDYDPLEIAVKEAHDRGLSIHAWINPMRLMTDNDMKKVSSDYIIRKWYNDENARGKYIVNSSGRWYLSPAYDETVDLICQGISEILSGYNVDGIQIDDYFYPTTDSSFDEAAFAASGTSLSLEDWRREKVTAMIKKMYSTVHSVNPTAVFGISPQGNAASDYNTLYADVYRWVSEEGCCDYICPQIYYGFDNSSLPYAETVNMWKNMITRSDIDLVVGLAAYKSGLEDKYAGDGKYEWQENTDILARQRKLTDSLGAGYAFFRYDSLFVPDPTAAVSVNAELDALKR